MTDPNDFIRVGDEYLEHFGKKGMRWGHRTASSGSKSSVSRKRAVSYTVAGTAAGATGALGLLAANRVLRKTEAKQKSKNAFRRGAKSTLLVTAKIGSTVVAGLLPIIGIVAFQELTGPEYRTDNGGQTGRDWDQVQRDMNNDKLMEQVRLVSM